MLTQDVTTLLVVEDDLRLRALYSRTFEAAGVNVLTAAGVLDARGILRSAVPAAVILDIGLEDESGLELLSELPGGAVKVVVTGRRDEDLVRVVLSAGADDLVFKPFVREELVARVLGRLEARNGAGAGPCSGERTCLKVDLGAGNLSCARRECPTALSEREVRALRILIEARGDVVSRETLSREVHHEPWDPNSRRVDALVSRLRKKLECGTCGAHSALSTVHNRGYRFAAAEHMSVER